MTDLSTTVGSVRLKNPVMTAAGTAGFGLELGRYLDLQRLGAFVTKSLSLEPWAGNPSPRVTQANAAMLNSVGLDNPGIDSWLKDTLPQLRDRGATVVVSIWGTSVAGYAAVAARLKGVDGIAAVEVNVSCPNVEERSQMFSHSPELAAAAISAAQCDKPLWAKLSPNVTDLNEIVGAVTGAGAEAVTLINTVLGMSINIDKGSLSLGNGGGGLSGVAIRPVAVRAVYEARRSFPDLPIVGVGGIASGDHAVELLMAGADAIQVGTATFYDPRAVHGVQDGLEQWMKRRKMSSLDEVIGVAHAG